MIKESILQLNSGVCSLGSITVHRGRPNTGRFVCRAGEKNFDRFFYIIQGSFNIQSQNRTVQANAGSLLYLPAGVAYESQWMEDVPGEYYSFMFYLQNAKTGAHLPLSKKIELFNDDGERSVLQQISRACNIYLQQEKYCGLLLQGIFYEITKSVLAGLEQKKLLANKKSAEIYHAILYLNSNYMQEITTEQLAALCCQSPATFRRMFKKYKGLSPMQYRTKLRLNHAREMLKSGCFTVSEVADLMHCTDVSHFSKQYQQQFGRRPSADTPKFD